MSDPWVTYLNLAMHGDWTAVRRLEDEIDRRMLWPLYTESLLRIAADLTQSKGIYWALIRATPEQRARAFLAATEGL